MSCRFISEARDAEYYASKVPPERPDHLRPGGQRVQRRQHHPVAAGRAGAHLLRPGVRPPGGERAGQRRRLCGARLHRPGRPLLGHVRPGSAGGHHPGDQPGPHHPGGSGVHRLPGVGPGRRHGEGHGHLPERAQRRRWGQPGQLPDAVPGRHSEQARLPPQDPGDHRPGGRLSGGAGGGLEPQD